MIRSKPMAWLAGILYAMATITAMQFYIIATRPWLDAQKYYSGTERLPFQERVLPIPILKSLDHVAASVHYFKSGNGVFTQSLFAPFLLSLAAFAIASIFVWLLYRAASRSRALPGVVLPIFLTLTLATYVVHSSANYFYPYDMPALAFFAAGFFFIYRQQFWLLLLVMVAGTLNRETTCFLIVVYMLDAAALIAPQAPGDSLFLWLSGLPWRRLPWLRAVCLAAVWLTIKIVLMRRFAANDKSEDYIRFFENLHRLTPKLWPTILDICGYVLPVVFLYRSRLSSRRLAAWLLVAPLWVAAMFFTGVISETRIYGELIPLVAVAATLLLEERAASARVDEDFAEADIVPTDIAPVGRMVP